MPSADIWIGMSLQWLWELPCGQFQMFSVAHRKSAITLYTWLILFHSAAKLPNGYRTTCGIPASSVHPRSARDPWISRYQWYTIEWIWRSDDSSSTLLWKKTRIFFHNKGFYTSVPVLRNWHPCTRVTVSYDDTYHVSLFSWPARAHPLGWAHKLWKCQKRTIHQYIYRYKSSLSLQIWIHVSIRSTR